MEDFAILYEDDDILVANKLSPIPVQREKSGDESLQDKLKALLAARPGAPDEPFLEAAHRIDRRASGAVVFGKTRRAVETLDADFRARRVGKDYLACVEREPVPPEARLEHRLLWDKRRNVVRAGKEGDLAVLEYHLSARSERYWLLEIELHTGRHHQIRAQLSAAGFPIRGDVKYGAKRTTRNGLIMLHARKISLTQPRSREAIDLVAPFPPGEPLWEAFAAGGSVDPGDL